MNYTFQAPRKDPQARLYHAIDWRSWLQDGETVAAYELTSDESLVIDGEVMNSGLHSYWVSGGVALQDFLVTSQITTSLGRQDQRSVRYQVRER